jgi:hypothetical protein
MQITIEVPDRLPKALDPIAFDVANRAFQELTSR